MSSFLLSAESGLYPLRDTSLIYINPASYLSSANFTSVANTLSVDELNQVRFGFYVGLSSCYPRFTPDQSMFDLHSNPIYNILPDKNPKSEDFTTITDAQALRLQEKTEAYEKVYLFWSGGIDSTAILCAILKNWGPHSLSKLSIVLNRFSIEENPNMYFSYVHGKLKEVSTDLFFSGEEKMSHDSLYITGDTADPLMGYVPIYKFDQMYPGLYKLPWRKNIDKLTSYFSNRSAGAGEYVINCVIDSLNRTGIELESVYDFLWWLDFNWGYDVDVYLSLWVFHRFPENVNVKRFMENNLCLFFNSKEYQNWAMTSIGTNLRIADSADTHKISLKRYIYDFNHDFNYFKTKIKEASTTKNTQTKSVKRLFAIDLSYNMYYLDPHVW